MFALALAARLAAIARAGFGTLRFGDSLAYIHAARQLLHDGRYPAWTDLFIFRPPGYPAFLAASTLGHPEAVAVDKLWNALLGSLAVLVLAGLARRMFPGRVALAVGILAALHPPLLHLCSDVESEPLFLLLLLIAAFLLLTAGDRPSSGLALLAGGALGLAALTRPTALALAPLLAAPLADRRFPFRIRASLAASAGLGLLFAVGPWTLRNALRFHAFLPVNDGGGQVFYQGNSEANVRYYRIRTRAEYDRWVQESSQEIAAGWDRTIPGVRDANPARRSAAFRRAALEWIRRHPGEEARLLARKALDWVRPWANPLVWGLPLAAASGLDYALLFLCTGVGLWTAPRRGASAFAIALLLVSAAVHVVYLVSWRYRTAYWDPVLLLYAPTGFLRLAAKRGRP